MPTRTPPADAGFLGQGVAYPPALDGAGRLALSSGLKSVEDSLLSILQTQPGERPMLPTYGAAVGMFEPFDGSRLTERINQNIVEHEPRITNFRVSIALGASPEIFEVTVNYEVAGAADARTLTYPIFTGPST